MRTNTSRLENVKEQILHLVLAKGWLWYTFADAFVVILPDVRKLVVSRKVNNMNHLQVISMTVLLDICSSNLSSYQGNCMFCERLSCCTFFPCESIMSVLNFMLNMFNSSILWKKNVIFNIYSEMCPWRSIDQKIYASWNVQVSCILWAILFWCWLLKDQDKHSKYSQNTIYQ